MQMVELDESPEEVELGKEETELGHTRQQEFRPLRSNGKLDTKQPQ